MPILAKEVDIYPDDLFDLAAASADPDRTWWAFHTRPRWEKKFARLLRASETPFYAPVIPKRFRSPGGSIRTTYVPLFGNYVFVFGDEDERYQAVTSNCVVKWLAAPDQAQLTVQLTQIRQLIEMGRPLTPESRLIKGDRVRVRSGGFMGYEGTVIRRNNEIRLLITVDFMQQGVSAVLDDCQLERI